MKSFREFITEKSEADPISRKDAEKLQRMARPETSSSSAERIRRGLESAQERKVRKTRRAPSALTQGQITGAWKSGSAGKSSVVATSSKPESGTWFGSSKKAIETGQEALRQQVRDTLAKNKGGSAELQAAQSSGPKETMVGKGAKSGTGSAYRANRPSETKATGVSNLPPKGQSRGRIGSKQFSGDARYREMLAKMPSAEPKKPRTKPVKQAEVSKEIKKSLAAKSAPKGVQSPREVSKAIGTYSREQQRRYQSAKSDIAARKGFSDVKKGGLSDRIIPGSAGEHAAKVRARRAAKLGSNVWSPKRGATSFEKIFTQSVSSGKQKMVLPDPWTGKERGSVPKKTIPQRYQVAKAERPTQRPVNATTHGIDTKGNYLSKDERKRLHSGKPGAITKYKAPPKPPSQIQTLSKNLTAKIEKTKTDLTTAADTRAREAARSRSSSRSLRRAGAGGILSALGAAQEYKVGAARAKREGRSKLGQMFRGGARAAGAFLGGTGGSAAGGAVAGGVGAIAGGAYGYSKGAELGSKLAKNVEKSSAAKWLAKTARKYVPGLG